MNPNLYETTAMHLKIHQSAPLFILIFLTLLSCEPLSDAIPEPTGNTRDEPVQHQPPNDEISVEDQYIVALNRDELILNIVPGLNLTHHILDLINHLIRDTGIAENEILYRYTHSFIGFSAKLNDKQLRDLKADERVAYVEPDQIIRLIPPLPITDLIEPFPGNTEQSIPYGISRVGGPFNGAGMTAWIIDTGVDLDHNDLNVDVERSRSFVLIEPTADDFNGHGTHVAGTIAALDNDIDVVGVAAGASVVAVKVLGAAGIGTNSGVIAGIDYVAEHAAPGETANMSLGGASSEALDEAVRGAADRGILFSIAAGNDSEHAGNYSPARVEHENTWTVSAVDENDTFASFSNYGNPPIRFAAPGVSIESLWFNNGTHTISGTSMAAPHVAGILLASDGNPGSDGTATDDPDGNPDPIVYHQEGQSSTLITLTTD